jgi:hypothetical protein
MENKNVYSCGNVPMVGDVVEVVTLNDIEGEKLNWTKSDSLMMGKHYVVSDIAFQDKIAVEGKGYFHHFSRFRLIRRSGEQPQPDYAKMLEEKDREIAGLKKQNSALKLMADSAKKIMEHTSAKYNKLSSGLAGLDSERDMNVILTKELEEKDEAIRELVDFVSDIYHKNLTNDTEEREAKQLLTKYSKQ